MTNTTLSENEFMVFAFIFVGLGVFMGWFIFDVTDYRIELSNQTGYDLCKNIVNSSVVEASSEEGELICTIPSYDSTTNVHIRKAGEAR